MKIVKYIEILIFHNRINYDEIVNKIVKKFNNGAIDTKKLHGQLQGKFSFWLNDQQRAIGVICPYQGKTSLVILELLLDHKYDNYHKDKGLSLLDLDKKISEEGWKVFKREEVSLTEGNVDSSVAVSGLPQWSIQLDTIAVLDTQQLAILEQTNERPVVTITGALLSK